jgi:hypothetical protein
MKTNRQHQVISASIAVLGFALLAQSAGAQPTPAQQNAVRQHCRTDFRALCSHVKSGGSEALACLGEHVERLSPACQDAVFATMPTEPAEPAEHAAVKRAPAAVAAPPPQSTATAKPVAIRSLAPPPARPAKRPIRHPASVTVATPAVAPTVPSSPPAAAQKHAAVPPPSAAPLKHAAVPPPPKASTKHAAVPPPPKASTKHAAVPPPQHPSRAPAVKTTALQRACRVDQTRHCRGVRPGGSRELACLAAHRNALTLRCRTALMFTSRTR